MNTIIDLTLIALIVCFIVDVSGIMTDIRKKIADIIYKKTNMKVDPTTLKLKPIGCSLCMCFWTGIIFLLCTSSFTLANLAYVCFLALLSSNLSELLFLIKDILATLGMKIQKLIQK